MNVSDVVSSLKEKQIYDYLRVSGNDKLKAFLSGSTRPGSEDKDKEREGDAPTFEAEELRFADSVMKINRRNRSQARVLVITDRALYNFKPKKYSKCQRRIAIDELETVVLSKSSDEVVFKVMDNYDYRYVIQRRAEVLETLSKHYKELTDADLPVTLTEDENLSAFVKTKAEVEALAGGRGLSSPSLGGMSGALGTPKGHQRAMSRLPSDSTSVRVHNRTTGFRFPGTTMEGWLTKKKGSKDKWDRKYVELTQEYLRYSSPAIKGNFPLPAEVKLFDATQQRSDMDESGLSPWQQQCLGSLKYAMEIVSPKKTVYIAAESEEERERWKAAFEHAAHNEATDGDDELDEYVHLEGWLLKRDPTRGTWRRRYFVIVAKRCWYMEMNVKNAVEVASGVGGHETKTVQPTEDTHANFAGTTSLTRFAYRFNVSDSKRVYKLAADSQEDMRSWIAEIEKVSRAHKKGLTRNTEALVPQALRDAVNEKAPEGDVTIVFTDVQSSTNLWEKCPDSMDSSLTFHDNLFRKLLKEHSGYEVKTEGDAFMVTFFHPFDAIKWCFDVQLQLVEAPWDPAIFEIPGASHQETESGTVIFHGIRVRMGIHLGTPNCRRNPVTGRMDYFGNDINLSARVSDAGHGGQILITQPVLDLFKAEGAADLTLQSFEPALKDLGMHSFKGIKDPLPVYELLPGKLAERSDVFPPIRSMPPAEPSGCGEEPEDGVDDEDLVLDSDEEQELAKILGDGGDLVL